MEDVRSGCTTNHMSGPSGSVEMLPGAERRPSWTSEQKPEIVSVSLGPDLTPTMLARKYGISVGQIYIWRHQLLNGQSAPLLQSPRFAAVELSPSPSATSPCTPGPASAPGSIEIVLPGGVLVCVDLNVDARALRRVLAALSER